MTAFKAAVSVCAVVGLMAGTANAVTIATVPVGDPGNSADTRVMADGTTGYGSVAYNYRIGTYEVTAGQYTEFLNKVAATDTYELYITNMSDIYGCGIMRSGNGTIGNPYTYAVASDSVTRPVNCVSYWDACRFVNWLSNGQPTGAQGAGTTEGGAYTLNGYNGFDGRTIQRNPGSTWAVPSEDEWYKAAYYKGGSTNAGYWDYPTRSNTAPGQDMADASGNNANSYTAPYAWPIDSLYYTTVAGQFKNSASPYGTFDQGGNVWEWNEAIGYQESTLAFRGIRGGSFDGLSHDLLASARANGWPTDGDYFAGFRLVYVPEPTTLMMLALASVGAIRRRRA